MTLCCIRTRQEPSLRVSAVIPCRSGLYVSMTRQPQRENFASSNEERKEENLPTSKKAALNSASFG